jgi:iron complex outermembrane receptor protein
MYRQEAFLEDAAILRPPTGASLKPSSLGSSGPIGLILLACSSAWANNLPHELDFFEAIPTLTSATRLRETALQTPVSVTILDREVIDASTATSIPDLLRLVPGFQVAHATGAQYTATYHGVSDQLERRIEVMVNGNPVYQVNGTVEWNLLGVPLEDIDRIEVVRSPNSPAIGGNAVHGSINIITRKPFELAGTYLRATAGSLDTLIGVARIGGQLGRMDTVATFQYSEDDGFTDVDDHKRINNLRIQADLSLSPVDTLDIEAGFSEGEVGADGVGTELEPFRDRRLKDSHQTMTWRRSQPDGERFRVAFIHRATSDDDSYRYFIDKNRNLYVPLGSSDVSSERLDLEVEHGLAPTRTWRFLWGAGARYDVVRSDLYLARNGGEVSAWTGRLLAAAEWRPIETVHVNLNALTEIHEIADTYTSPRLGVSWRFAEGQALRAGVSQNYRVFGPGEQLAYYPLVLSDGTYLGRDLVRATGPGLEPERLTSYEAGYRREWPDHRLQFDLKIFKEELKDAWSGARDPNRTTIWSGENGRWSTKGLEAQLNLAPDDKTQLIGSYAYAETDGSEFTRIDSDGRFFDRQSLDDTTPAHTLALQLSRRLQQGWLGTLALFHASDMRWLGEGGKVDAYTRLDAKISKSIKLGDTQAALSFIVQNLTNDGYFEFRPNDVFEKAGNLFDRRFFLQVSLQWPRPGI